MPRALKDKQELSKQSGHFRQRATCGHYEQVRKAKLGDKFRDHYSNPSKKSSGDGENMSLSHGKEYELRELGGGTHW